MVEIKDNQMTKPWLNQHIKSAQYFPGLSLADVKQY